MIGLRWQLGVIVLVVVLLLILGWKKMGYYNVRQDWKAILFYAVVTFGITQVIYLVSYPISVNYFLCFSTVTG